MAEANAKAEVGQGEPESTVPSAKEEAKEEEAPAVSEGCAHYRRRCQIKSPCCDEWFDCHSCHDEKGGKDGKCWQEMKGTVDCMINGRETIGRYAVKRVRCNACGLEQGVNQTCEGCGIKFSNYFCADCKLYSSQTEVYHCDKCRVCRVGKGLGKSHFHCDKCDACYSLNSRDTHRCVERALESNCPVCLQLLFTSSEPLFVGQLCGHAIHSSCCKSFFENHRYKCPTCGKPLIDLSKIERQPPPDEPQRGGGANGISFFAKVMFGVAMTIGVVGFRVWHTWRAEQAPPTSPEL